MRHVFILIILICFVIACHKQEKIIHKANYSVKIDYLNLPTSDEREMVSDTLLIVFYGEFLEDTISVMLNERHFKDTILSTDARTGWSGDLNTIKYNDVKSVAFRINNGNLIYVEPPTRHYNIMLLYFDSIATLSFHRRLPAV